MRHDVNDPELIASWAEHIDYERVFPLIALVGDRIVGNCTLHFNSGPARHRAELRIFLTKDLKRRGLGTRLIQEAIEIARKRNIYLIEVQAVSEQAEHIKAFQKLGFTAVCKLEDFFMMPDGELRDVLHMVLRLHRIDDEF